MTFTGPATLTGGRTIQVMDPAQTVTFAGGIGEGIFGSQALTKGGRGTLVLTGGKHLQRQHHAQQRRRHARP